MGDVIVVIGAGQIGQAIARRISAGKHVMLADLHRGNADAAAEVLANAGFEVSTATVDVSSRESVHALAQTATAIGDVTGVIHAAGVSPSQARPEVILAVDLYGTALVLEEFGNIIAPGGSGVVIASQSGHRLGALTAQQDAALATTPANELLALPMLQPDQISDSLHAYQLAKRGNSLRVMAEAIRWGKRGARVNTISPGIIITPLARDELTGPRGEGYRRMIGLCPAGRAGTPDEVGTVGALLMGPDGAFITGSDFLMDGGVTASYFFGTSRLIDLSQIGDEHMDISRGVATAKGPAETFTGEAWIDPITRGLPPSPLNVAAVHFTPGARSAWHSHQGGQTLYVTEGHGLVQARGQEIVELNPGDVVFAPDGEEHWHGATPDHFMTHLSITEGAPRWGAHVTDTEYRGQGNR